MGKLSLRTRCSSITNRVITLFLFHILASLYTFNSPSTHYQFGASATRVGSSIWGVRADSKLDPLSDEAWCSVSLDMVAPREWNLEEVVAFNFDSLLFVFSKCISKESK